MKTYRIPKYVRHELAHAFTTLADDALVHALTNEEATKEDLERAALLDNIANNFRQKGPFITLRPELIPLVIRECNNRAEVERDKGCNLRALAFIDFACRISPN